MCLSRYKPDTNYPRETLSALQTWLLQSRALDVRKALFQLAITIRARDIPSRHDLAHSPRYACLTLSNRLACATHASRGTYQAVKVQGDRYYPIIEHSSIA